jgi:hypothetical protein
MEAAAVEGIGLSDRRKQRWKRRAYPLYQALKLFFEKHIEEPKKIARVMGKKDYQARRLLRRAG